MGVYESLHNYRIIPQNLYHDNVTRLHNMNSKFVGEKFIEGLSTLDFKLLSIHPSENYMKIKVEI